MDYEEFEITNLDDAMDYLRDAGLVDGLYARDCVEDVFNES